MAVEAISSQKSTKKVSISNKKPARRLILFLLPVFIIWTAIAAFNLYFKYRIFPGVHVANINLGSKTKPEALEELRKNATTPEKITIRAKNKTFDFSLTGVDLSYNLEKTLDDAFGSYRDIPLPLGYLQQINSFRNEKHLGFKINLNSEKLEEYLHVISAEVAKEPVLPTVTFVNNNIIIGKGAPGETADVESFKKDLIFKISNKKFDEVNLNFIENDLSLTEEGSQKLYQRAQNLIGKSIVLEKEFNSFALKENELFTFLDGNGKYYENTLNNYISTRIEPLINREPQNAVFKFENDRVLEFKPAKPGLTVNKDGLKNELFAELEKLETSSEKLAKIEIPVESKSPEITTDKVNDLGIKELLGRGTSKFVGSIPSRMHNIALATSKFNGILVPPGEEFSFNSTLGDVSSFTGYKQAYVIRDGRTVLGDGGGVCQVSSTLFRALLNAGLPITERRPHSYRVGYYEQDVGPGLDATVFSPTTDLKFRNDTPGHLLIQTEYDGKNASLVFEIYGTSDGRVATTTKPVILSQTKPPEDVFIDDPSLPAGQVKQVEHRAFGARVSFDHKVERNGEVIFQKTFLSAYRPWGAVFMRGTGPTI